jgi:hypothetical protein
MHAAEMTEKLIHSFLLLLSYFLLFFSPREKKEERIVDVDNEINTH